MLLWTPAPPPVSYSGEVAPIFAMYCNSCHGGAGGLSTRSWDELMQGGHLGKVVIPGQPKRSLLLDFIDGRRGAEQRMPIGGAPLTRKQIQTIARWIAEGAKQDADTTASQVRSVPNVLAGAGKLIHIRATVDTESYLILTIRDPVTGRSLLTEAASIKVRREENDAGSPGQPLVWDIRTARSWPERVDVVLLVKYAPETANVHLSAEVMNRP